MKRITLASSVAAFAIVASTFAITPQANASSGSYPSGLISSTVSGALELQWDSVPNSSGYQVQLSYDENFSTILETQTVHALKWAPRRVYNTENGGRLYWRVAAFGANQWDLGSWSPVKYIDLAPLTTPSLVTPADGVSINYPKPIALKWDTVPGALAYEVQIAANNDFTNDSTVMKHTNIEGTAFSLATLPSGNWGWRVLARQYTPDGKIVWSAPSKSNTFTNRWTSEDSEVQLIEPAHTVTPTTSTGVSDPIFSWKPVSGASYYKIVVTRDSNLTNVAIPETVVYGTSFIPKGYLLNGEYYWQVTAYDVDNNPGSPSSTRRFVKRWGMQAGPNQLAVNEPEARPVPKANTGSASFSNPQAIDRSKFELKWEPVPRVNKYVVTVKNVSGQGSVYTCTTSNISATMVEWYQGGAQSPELYRHDTNCLVGLAQDGGGTYEWRVQGYDSSASGETYGQGPLVTAESEPRYFTLVDSNAASGGTANSAILEDTLSEDEKEKNENGIRTLGSPAPLLEWKPLPNSVTNCAVYNRPGHTFIYEVRVYRGDIISTTTEIARFRTQASKFRAPGTFRDDNTNIPYHWRVRGVCGDLEIGNNWDHESRIGKQWVRTTSPTIIPTSYVTEQNGAIQINWTPQFTSAKFDAVNKGYRLHYRKQGTVSWTLVDLEFPSWIPADHSGWPLAPDTYEFRIQPLDSNHDAGRYSSIKTFTIAPTVPSGLTVEQSGSATATVKWDASPAAGGYQVQRQKGSGAWESVYVPNVGDTTKQTSMTSYLMEPGSWNFRVRSVASGYYSQWAPTVNINVMAKNVIQTTSDGVTLPMNNRVLKWDAVPGASRYLLYISDNANTAATNNNPIETVNSMYTVPDDLVYGKPYYWRVVPIAETSWSNQVRLGNSNVRSFYVTTAPRTSPNQRLELADGLKVRVSWDALTGENAGTATGVRYQVRWRKANQVPVADWSYSTPAAVTSYLTSPLDVKSTYEFQTSAINDEGQGRWSNSNFMDTAGTPNSPDNFNATPDGENAMWLSWWGAGDNGSPVTKYVVSWKTDNASEWKTASTKETSFRITGLKGFTNYQIRVAAVNGVGTGAYSMTEIKTLGYPMAPTSLTAKSGNGKMTVSWSAPSSSGTSPVREYKLEAKSGKGDWVEVGKTAGRTLEHGYLINGDTWTYRISAFNNEGQGRFSSTVTNKVGKANTVNLKGKAKAGKTTIKKVKVKGKVKKKKIKTPSTITISWTKPSSGGAPIKSYTIQYSTDGKKWKTLTTTTKNSVTTSKGAKGKNLYFRGLTKNKYGSSHWSKVIKVKKK